MSGCCDEYNCKRQQPFLIRRAPFSGRVLLVARHTKPDDAGYITALQKHDITAEFEAFCKSEGYVRKPPERSKDPRKVRAEVGPV